MNPLPLLLLLVGPPQDPPVPAEDRALPESVVIARKWQELADEVPSSLASLDEADLEDAGITTIRDATLRIPNLFLTQFSSRRLSFPTMRGIGSGQGDPAVVTYVGGVPQLDTNSTNLPLFDVERVEFLRGPHSTLYGRSALGGVIHVIPRAPSGSLSGGASASLGNYELQQYSARASGPLYGDDLFFRAGAFHSQRDGYTINDYTGNDVDFKNSTFGRGSLLWTPSERSEIELTLHGERSRDGGFVLSDLDGIRRRPFHVDQDFEGRAERDLLAPSLTWTHTGDDLEWTSVSAFQDWSIEETSDFDFTAIDGIRRRSADSQGYFNQEVRLATPPEDDGERGFRWLTGVNFFAADTSRSGATEFRPGLFPPPQQGTDTQSGDFDDWGLAIFGQTTVPLGEWLDLGAGLRFDHESKSADLRRTFETGGIVVSDSTQSLSESFDEVVPEVSLSSEVTDDALVYTRVAKGFKAGGFNLAAPADRFSFGPETTWTWELGAKASWLEDRLHLTAALFYIDWDNMQLSLFDATTGGYVDNVGKANSRGLEAELRGEPVEHLELFGGFGYTDASFDEYTDPYGANVAGNTLPFVPETTWNLGGTLSGDLASHGRWFLYAAWIGVGRYFFDAGNRESESFNLLDLRAGVERGGWKLELWTRNALDEEYVQLAFQPSPLSPDAFVGENGAPMTFGFTLSAGF